MPRKYRFALKKTKIPGSLMFHKTDLVHPFNTRTPSKFVELLLKLFVTVLDVRGHREVFVSNTLGVTGEGMFGRATSTRVRSALGEIFAQTSRIRTSRSHIESAVFTFTI